MKPCKNCENDLGVYDFSLDCCLTRYALSAPTRDRLIMHLQDIQRRHGKARADLIMEAVKQARIIIRAKVFKFGKVNKS